MMKNYRQRTETYISTPDTEEQEKAIWGASLRISDARSTESMARSMARENINQQLTDRANTKVNLWQSFVDRQKKRD